jgi:hypothetical protein
MIAKKNERRNQSSISDTNLWKSRSWSIVISRFVKRMLFKISRQMLHLKFTYNLPTSVAVNKWQNRSTWTVAQCEEVTQNPPLSEERWKSDIIWRSYQSDLFVFPPPFRFSYPRQLYRHSLTYAIVMVPEVAAQIEYFASRVWVYIWSKNKYIYIYKYIYMMESSWNQSFRHWNLIICSLTLPRYLSLPHSVIRLPSSECAFIIETEICYVTYVTFLLFFHFLKNLKLPELEAVRTPSGPSRSQSAPAQG